MGFDVGALIVLLGLAVLGGTLVYYVFGYILDELVANIVGRWKAARRGPGKHRTTSNEEERV